MAVCVFVCLSANSDVSDYLHLSSGVWVYVCVCSVMFDTALEQWWMAVWVCVCVCVCVCAQSCLTVYQSSGIWVCACVCVVSPVQLFAPEQWHMGV